MTYASGGLIQAADYNTLATNINTIWAAGSGQAGYGQPPVATVSAASTVTATQWSTLIGTINNSLAHQSGTAAISLPTAGSVITYLAAVASGVSTATTNKALAAANGTTVTGTVFSPNFTVAATTSAYSNTITRTVTFASADHARYFFNAGGKLNLVIPSVTVGDGTARSTDIQTMLQTDIAGIANIGGTTNSGRTGSGGTLNTNNTALGYWNAGTSLNTITSVTSTTAGYTSDTATVQIKTSGASGANGDVGAVVTLVINFTSGAHAFASSINVTVNHRIDIIPPESTNLTNTWGTVTVS